MAFTRYNYDDLRTKKILQESTGLCRYQLNVPGPHKTTCFMEDPQVRLQKFGGNNRRVNGGHPIDIDSDLTGRTRQLKKYCTSYEFPNKGVVKSAPIGYGSCNAPITDQSRATHPARSFRSLPNKPKVNFIMMPIEGDYSSDYWFSRLAMDTGGCFITASKDWLVK